MVLIFSAALRCRSSSSDEVFIADEDFEHLALASS
jgi:hypothetical protein